MSMHNDPVAEQGLELIQIVADDIQRDVVPMGAMYTAAGRLIQVVKVFTARAHGWQGGRDLGAALDEVAAARCALDSIEQALRAAAS